MIKRLGLFLIVFVMFLLVVFLSNSSVVKVDAQSVVDIQSPIVKGLSTPDNFTEGVPANSFSANRIIVLYKDGYTPDSSLNAQKIPFVKDVNIYAIPVENATTSGVLGDSADVRSFGNIVAETIEQKELVLSTLADIKNDPNVLEASPDFFSKSNAWNVTSTRATPGDWDINKHWYYDSGKLPEYWHSLGCPTGDCGGSDQIVVAVIDTGLVFESYDDRGVNGFTGNYFSVIGSEYTGANFNLYQNTGETPNNGRDDDCNGVVDDYRGMDSFAYGVLEDIYTFSELTCNPTPVDYSGSSYLYLRKPGHPVDSLGHGSFVTGNIAGLVDNGGDTVSPASNVTIMPIAASVNWYDPVYYGLFSDWDLMVASAYAVSYGADVVNMSLGGFSYDPVADFFFSLLSYFDGTVFVAASGNDSNLTNLVPVSYPAAYNSVISVGALDIDNTRATYSNGGSDLDLVAYVGDGGYQARQQTLSCFPCSYSGPFSSVSSQYSIGTSFASPQVAAAAAYVRSFDPTFTPEGVKTALLSSTNDVGTTGYDTKTGNGVLNWSKLPSFDLSSALYNNFTIYRWTAGDKAWLWVGNPDTTETAHVLVRINGIAHGYYLIEPQTNTPIKFPDIFEGPVEILSDIEVNVTQKILTSAGKLNEQVAITSLDYAKKFYFPIYRWLSGDRAWIWIANPSSGSSAHATVKIGSYTTNHTIPPKSVISVKQEGLFEGPVVITSDINVYATLKSLTNGGINEFKGISSSETDTTFYYPIYRWVGKDNAWVWIGNPSVDTAANVNVATAGNYMGSYVVPAGENISVKYTDVFDGPLVVTSDLPVFSTLKTRVGGVINEFPGIRSSDFSTGYYYPVYRWTGGDKSWIWVGNPDGSNVANIDISIAGSWVGSYVIPPGENISVKYDGVFAGPVEISSDIPIYSTLKSLVNGSINEFVGIK
ncbi:S8 family serine peptidase [Candidatus Dojkabacteria bacterium]|uniref:S8 family serine peptidase n=1 Tax=Candidatus Dojkabacteria bacterium TaxID=2099670 RepID=A0A955KWV3_9BACT|nr:S8 family serine peptidase [Candidatus Dojkabacteria bacterium]